MRQYGWTMAGAMLLGLGGVAAEPASVAIQVGKDQIEFRIGSELVGRYHIGPDVAKPYFWPLHGPGGIPVTRGWPMVKGLPNESTDHVHQKSLWFCHGDVIPEGIELKQTIKGVKGVDFWSEAPGHGRIVCTRVGEPRSDGRHAQVTTHNEWRTADGVKVLDETRTLHLYDLGAARLLVFDIDLHARVVPITFGDTKEGAMGLRVHDAIREVKGAGKLENAEGQVGEKQIWGRKSAWCDYSGPLDGKVVGVALLDDPRNPHPACWHSRGYGLMAANPFGRDASGFPGQKGNRELVRLAKGEHLKLRYGVLVHLGDAREGKVAEHYQRFAQLPR
ncbi:MAG: PmoA family protein [Gemmataceae bacterium]|nr:PmoA family protein [Gemmataceae bacterium]